MYQERCKRIRSWFESSEDGAALLLPNGWFGQPPGTHVLTYLVELKHKTVLELDERTILSFSELGEVREEGPDLVLGRFRQLVLDWEEGEPPVPHAYLYRSGEVRFVRQERGGVQD